MSAAEALYPLPEPEAPPPLQSGDHLTRAEFERRCEAMPHLKKAELLQGVVYTQPRVRLRQHGHPHLVLAGWLGLYKFSTPGVDVGDNSTIRLEPESEPQGDALLMIPREPGIPHRFDE